MNLIELFQINWLVRPDKPAIHLEDQTLTFGDLDRESNRIAHGLQRLGLRRGDRVALYINNSFELIQTYVANLKLGLITVPMNTQYRDTEITHILSDAQPRLILTDRTQLPILQPVISKAPVEHLLISDELKQLEKGESSGRLSTRIDDDDLALLIYTSGTTGRSKGAMLSHNNLAANITALVAAWAWTAEDRLLLTLPLFHMHGLGVALHGALATGCTVHLHTRFQPPAVLDSLSNNQISLYMAVPTMYVRLLQEVERRGWAHVDLPHMRLFVSGSAPLDAETFQSFEQTFGHKILERYGMTETGMNLSNLYAGPRVPGSVGVPLPGVCARIVNDRGGAVPDGEVGEVLLRGSNVFRGYWNAPEKTQEAFVTDAEGMRWFRTGDLGRRDPSTGLYTLVGRKHDLIISGGYNIYPREIEDLLASHPAVLEAAVVGVPDPARGQLPVAHVALRRPASVSEQELLDYCQSHLAAFKVPRRITFVDALPRNAMGKVDRKSLH